MGCQVGQAVIRFAPRTYWTCCECGLAQEADDGPCMGCNHPCCYQEPFNNEADCEGPPCVGIDGQHARSCPRRFTNQGGGDQ